jgi:D-methionine transport system permease protein
MMGLSAVFALLIGIPLGILLVLSDKKGLMPMVKLNQVLSLIINTVRSIPSMILVVVLLPLARLIVGTGIGTNAAVVSVTVGMIPLIARVVNNSIKEVSAGKIEAAQAMGATNFEIVAKVLIPEALPSIVHGITMSIISLVGFTAIAGCVGGGGLGNVAFRYGYDRFRMDVLIGTVAILVLIVQVIQLSGDLWVKLQNKKIGVTK